MPKLWQIFNNTGRIMLLIFAISVAFVSSMGLQESFEKFKKQQEKCISIMASITPKACSVTTSQYQKDAAGTPSSEIKFSNDTERLQLINSIRKSPVGAQIKRVIDFLLETRQAFTAEEINIACYIDVEANRAVFDSLRNNLKVSYDGKRFSYKAKHDLKDENQLISLIQKFPEGIAVVDLKDAYPTVMDDLQALKATGQIWLLSNFDSHESIAYPNNAKISIAVDDDVKVLFRDIELPGDMIDIENDLRRNRIRPLTDTAARRAKALVLGVAPKLVQKKKPRQFSKRTRLTNSHLPELFQSFNVPAN